MAVDSLSPVRVRRTGRGSTGSSRPPDARMTMGAMLLTRFESDQPGDRRDPGPPGPASDSLSRTTRPTTRDGSSSPSLFRALVLASAGSLCLVAALGLGREAHGPRGAPVGWCDGCPAVRHERDAPGSWPPPGGDGWPGSGPLERSGLVGALVRGGRVASRWSSWCARGGPNGASAPGRRCASSRSPYGEGSPIASPRVAPASSSIQGRSSRRRAATRPSSRRRHGRRRSARSTRARDRSRSTCTGWPARSPRQAAFACWPGPPGRTLVRQPGRCSLRAAARACRSPASRIRRRPRSTSR